MRIRFCPQSYLPAHLDPEAGTRAPTMVEMVDQDTVRIDGEDFVFPPEISEFSQLLPIVSAQRSGSGELSIVVAVKYGDDHRHVWETADASGKFRGEDWETWLPGQTLYPEEVADAGNDGKD